MPVTGTGKPTGLCWLLCPGQEKKGLGVRGGGLHWRVQGSTSSPTGIGSRWKVFEVLWNLECPIELSQREIYAHFNEGNLAQFGRSAENMELWSYVVNFELVGRK